MACAKFFPLLSAMAVFAAGSFACGAQTVRTVPAPLPSLPFPEPASPVAAAYPAAELLPPARMTEADRQLEAAARSTIADRAAGLGIQFGRDGWNYRQIVCAALPGHLLLRFERDNGPGDVSRFSASIPRAGQGKIRIVPILRRGYLPFTPAPESALTVSAFNRIRAEEGAAAQADWLELGLCYASLAGATPWALEPAPAEQAGFLPVHGLAVLKVEQGKGATVLFTGREATPTPMDWALTFDERGTLLKAIHRPAATLSTRMLPTGAAVTAERPLPATITDPRALPGIQAPRQ